MSIWKPAPVTEEPQIALQSWAIYEASFEKGEPSRHFVGWDGSGRVSSAIVEFDKDTMRGKTRSGRIYQLVGSPGFNSDAEYVWGYWSQANKVMSYIDVSDQYYAKATEEKSEPTI